MSRLSSHRGGRRRIAPCLLALCTALTLAACSEPYNSVAPPYQAASATQANASAKGDRVATVDLTPLSASMVIGDTTMFTATPRDAKGNALTGRVVTWAISDTTIATVSPTGVVTALAAGAASVTATVDGKARSAALTVSAVTPPPGTAISPGQSIQAAVDANPPGTSFVLRAGVHRLQQVTPKSGNTFTGDAGAVMSGARLLTSFTREGSYWVATVQTQENTNRPGVCDASHPRCGYAEDLFIDDVMLTHVSSLAAVATGKWFFDYAAEKIYFVDDPTGHRVETSVSTRAFGGPATGVTIQRLTVEKYANSFQAGAVHPGGSGWVMTDNEIRWNHGEGIRIYDAAEMLRNNIHHNGQQGVGGTATTALVADNEIAWNNTAGADVNWAAGGVKITGLGTVQTTDVTFRNNRVHDNTGIGIWCDWNCLRITYDANTIERNTRWGLEHEISFAATIVNNIVSDNQAGQIFVSSSRDVEVANNRVTGGSAIVGLQENRGAGNFGAFTLQNLDVHNNVVTIPASAGDNYFHVGILVTNGDNTVWTGRNNRFASNRYTLSGLQRPFAWLGGYRTSAEWQAYGNDDTGTANP